MSIDWLSGPHERTTVQPFITGLIESAKYVMRDSHLDTGGYASRNDDAFGFEMEAMSLMRRLLVFRADNISSIPY
jgi:hypothetical protein